MKQKKPNPLSQALQYAGRYRGLSYLSWLLSGLSAVLALLPFVELFYILRMVVLTSPGDVQAAGIVRHGWLAVLFALLAMLVYFAALMCSHVSAFRVAGNMRKTLLAHIAKLPVGFAEAGEMGSGKLRRVVLESTAATETLLAHNLPDMVQAMVTPVCLVMMLFAYDWRFGLACLFPAFLAFCMMARMTGPGMQEDMKNYQDALEKMSNEAVEYIRGVPVVKTFGQTVFSFHRFKKAIDNYSEFCIHYTRTSRRPMVLFTVFVNSAFAFLIALALWLARGGSATQEILLHFLFYVMLTPVIVTALNRVMFLSENTMRIGDALTRINAILDMEPLPEPQEAKQPQGASVELRDVSYCYAGSAHAAVRHLSLAAEPGQIVALVGPSGSGKTTVAGLIARFFDPMEGTVCVGGVDIREVGKEKLMQTVSYVFQDSRLLKRSIAENLRIAKPDASDAELRTALQAAQCDDILARLPQGLDTVLGSEGTYLSGGEQQRLAIARAILKKSAVVLLDEATAFADPENEVLVQRAFTELTRNSTVIMIAHRLSTIRNADKIYILDRGEAVESGTHEDLLEKGGLYKTMWDEYQKAASWKVGETV